MNAISRDHRHRPAPARPRRALGRVLGTVLPAEAPARPAGSESLLALMTSWGVLASFGLCFVLSGLADSDVVVGLIGFACFLAGFGAHIVINLIYGIGFTGQQVALALGAFAVGVLCFIAGAVFDPGFTSTDLRIGIAGFGALAAGFVLYVLIRYGLRGSYETLYRLHQARLRP